MQWLRERWAALPSVPYNAITFTMPDQLWPLFQANPMLAQALPALAAATIYAHANAKDGVCVGVIGILHTFNPKLEFNSHVHAMVTAGGLSESSGLWVPIVNYLHSEIMQCWKGAVIELLRRALQSNQLQSDLPKRSLEKLFVQQEKRFWRLKIQSFADKEHFFGMRADM
jgi:hypothetical protein